MFKVNNRNTLTSCSSVSIVDFEQVNADWDDIWYSYDQLFGAIMVFGVLIISRQFRNQLTAATFQLLM